MTAAAAPGVGRGCPTCRGGRVCLFAAGTSLLCLAICVSFSSQLPVKVLAAYTHTVSSAALTPCVSAFPRAPVHAGAWRCADPFLLLSPGFGEGSTFTTAPHTHGSGLSSPPPVYCTHARCHVQPLCNCMVSGRGMDTLTLCRAPLPAHRCGEVASGFYSRRVTGGLLRVIRGGVTGADHVCWLLCGRCVFLGCANLPQGHIIIFPAGWVASNRCWGPPARAAAGVVRAAGGRGLLCRCRRLHWLDHLCLF